MDIPIHWHVTVFTIKNLRAAHFIRLAATSTCLGCIMLWDNDYCSLLGFRKVQSFGAYEDAFHKDYVFLYHSRLSCLLNIGLLDPAYVLNQVMKKKTHINNLEGFIRQLIGWRNYEIFLYKIRYNDLLQDNHFGNTRRLKWNYWLGKKKTGIVVLDTEIYKAIKHGYSHHIVRLMVFLNLFVLLQVCKEDIIKWFMEVVSIDAYDWVMLSNISSMGYFTPKYMQKPYISTSTYILKMSNYKKGAWCDIWDALFYSFLYVNKARLTQGASIYLRNLAYFERQSHKVRADVLQTARRFIDKVTYA